MEDERFFKKIYTNYLSIYHQVNTRKQIKAGIIGGTGYTGGELIRFAQSSNAELSFVTSYFNVGKKTKRRIWHQDLIGEIDLEFIDNSYRCRCLFLALIS